MNLRFAAFAVVLGAAGVSAGPCPATVPTQAGYVFSNIAAGTSSTGGSATVACANGYTGTPAALTCATTATTWPAATGCTAPTGPSLGGLATGATCTPACVTAYETCAGPTGTTGQCIGTIDTATGKPVDPCKNGGNKAAPNAATACTSTQRCVIDIAYKQSSSTRPTWGCVSADSDVKSLSATCIPSANLQTFVVTSVPSGSVIADWQAVFPALTSVPAVGQTVTVGVTSVPALKSTAGTVGCPREKPTCQQGTCRGAAPVAASTTVANSKYLVASIGDTDFSLCGNAVVTATSLVAGTPYIIKTAPTTAFPGATVTTAGTVFVSTGPASAAGGDAYQVKFIATKACSGGSGTVIPQPPSMEADVTKLLGASQVFDASKLTQSTNFGGASAGSNGIAAVPDGAQTLPSGSLTQIGADVTAKMPELKMSCTPVAAGSFVSGTQYYIAVVGDSTFPGASANTVGTSFTATGAGSGTGKAVTADCKDNGSSALALAAGANTALTAIRMDDNTGTGNVGLPKTALSLGTGTKATVDSVVLTAGKTLEISSSDANGAFTTTAPPEVAATGVVSGTSYVIKTLGTTTATQWGSLGATSVTAGAFVIGTVYIIATPGDQKFTTIGARDNNAGTIFKATGAGTASTATPPNSGVALVLKFTATAAGSAGLGSGVVQKAGTGLSLEGTAKLVVSGAGKVTLAPDEASRANPDAKISANGGAVLSGDLGKMGLEIAATSSSDGTASVDQVSTTGVSGQGTLTIPTGGKLTLTSASSTSGSTVTPTLNMLKGGTVDATGTTALSVATASLNGTLAIKAGGSQSNYIQDIQACGPDGVININLDSLPASGNATAMLNYDSASVPKADRDKFTCKVNLVSGGATTAATTVTSFPSGITTIATTTAAPAGRRLLATSSCTYAVWTDGSLQTAQGPCPTPTPAPGHSSAAAMALSAAVLCAVGLIHG